MGKRRRREAAGKKAQTTAPAVVKKGRTFRDQLEKRLHGAQFRSLNEELYARTGDENFERFRRTPSLAAAYHRGYREQVARWPVNPLDEIIAHLRSKKKGLAVADFGCGEARLAAELSRLHKVSSFDLVATREGVVACNMARTPLEAASIDVAVFCLALMGPSFVDFLVEARRVLKVGGHLIVAEVRSRFDEQHGGVRRFLMLLKAIGFDALGKPNDQNSHFLSFRFARSNRPLHAPKEKALDKKCDFAFKPCVYKRR